MSDRASKCIETHRWDYAIDGVIDTVNWSEISPSLNDDSNEAEIYDASGETLELGVGPSGSEARFMLIPPGGNGRIGALLNTGQRLSVRAVSADTGATGDLIINRFR